MPVLVLNNARFGEHTPPPGHPERPERQDVMEAVAARWRQRGGAVAEAAAPAPRDAILRVHGARFVETLEGSAGRAVMLDPDTFTSPESWEITQLAAGAAVGAVDAVLDGPFTRAAALVRPPGHHSNRDLARGFCLVNNAAVAAAHALARGLARVAVVDLDVHHGNGTQEIFEADPRVLYVSTHQWPFYPGTGRADDMGVGPGRGFTVNVPMERGATDGDYAQVFDDVVVPVTRLFNPDLVIISAGFDAHEEDPIGSMRMSADGFARLVGRLSAAAEDCAAGRVVLVTEGGYHLRALASSLSACLAAMDGGAAADPASGEGGGATGRGSAAVQQARAVQSACWRGL
ncbi:MAG: histone deacetylase [Vicinamibacterales bacterium]